MKKKLGFVVGALALTFMLSSCFMLVSFGILDYTLTPGQTTKARFTLRPTNFENSIGPPATGPQYEFVIIGIESGSDLQANTAKWGTTGTFGGPTTMAPNGALIGAMGSACSGHGINFQDLTGLTFKAYVTPTKIADKNKFGRSAVVEVVIKAQADASPGDEAVIFGIAGNWVDDGNDTPDGADFFLCSGVATTRVHIVAP